MPGPPAPQTTTEPWDLKRNTFDWLEQKPASQRTPKKHCPWFGVSRSVIGYSVKMHNSLIHGFHPKFASKKTKILSTLTWKLKKFMTR